MKKRGEERWLNGGTDAVLMLATPVVLITLWQVFSNKGVINQSVMPSPGRIADTAGKLISNGELARHLKISLARVLQGYLIGAAAGVTVGILMGLIRRIEKALTLVLGIIRPVPIIAWVPILILWIGIGETSKISIIAFGTFFPVLLNTIHGIRSTDQKLIEVAQVLEKGGLTTLFCIIFPSALPAIFTGLRIALGTAWMSVIGAEMIAASSGVGYFISLSSQLSQPKQMFVGVFAIGFVGVLFDSGLRLIERLILRWNVKK
jgi:sulfonate transport system permease protein